MGTCTNEKSAASETMKVKQVCRAADLRPKRQRRAPPPQDVRARVLVCRGRPAQRVCAAPPPTSGRSCADATRSPPRPPRPRAADDSARRRCGGRRARRRERAWPCTRTCLASVRPTGRRPHIHTHTYTHTLPVGVPLCHAL